ncbi:MAG: hypothetical protein COW84_01110 [Gammaproteobacteria bacterium CG22_combo_CG10-13_8_21_14_all_40_8]|nr:MAG: hypothetical protein COW84_01110 [Gammaproteobacteria bacterium CG22_combo_CG10-13_8_21_14_all_40_8]
MIALPNWDQISAVCIDMDGTLIDLYFDNHFWKVYLPEIYAKHQNCSLDASRNFLFQLFHEQKGQLNWYCLDFWSKTLKLDIMALKQSLAEDIRLRENALKFLLYVNQLGKPLYLVTNAHRHTLAIKLKHTGIESYFQKIISAHDLGLAKEQDGFWPMLAELLNLDLHSTLFIDDSESVLNAAKQAGVGHVIAIFQPDSQLLGEYIDGFPHLHNFSDMMEAK